MERYDKDRKKVFRSLSYALKHINIRFSLLIGLRLKYESVGNYV